MAIACYVVFCGGCAAVLLAWSHTTIEVSDGELRAGGATLPLAMAGEVVALDEPRPGRCADRARTRVPSC